MTFSSATFDIGVTQVDQIIIILENVNTENIVTPFKISVTFSLLNG